MPRTRGCYDSDPADWSPEMVEEFRRRKQRPICFEPKPEDYDEGDRWIRWNHEEEIRKRMFTCEPEEDSGARTNVACGKGPAKPAVKA